MSSFDILNRVGKCNISSSGETVEEHAHEIQKADCSSACPDWSERSHPTANEKNEMANVERCNISLKKENSNALALALRN